MKIKQLGIPLIVATVVTCAGTVKGQYTLTTLVSFDDYNGSNPVAGLLVDSSCNLYGTTSRGVNGSTVFKLDGYTHAFNTIANLNSYYSFSVSSLIADSSGNLYGTTAEDGANSDGTVFEVASGTHALNTLVTFNGANGANARASLIVDARGNLYGTTFGGGAGHKGTVFEVVSGTHALTTLATFGGANGDSPYAGLIADSNGNVYGTTVAGGTYDKGTVFEVAAGTQTLTTLATFNGTNGSRPYGGLIADASDNLYGTTYSGGVNESGTVFELAAGTHELKTLATFNGANGAFPYAGLVFDANGNLYGTTELGGEYNVGTVFEVAADTDMIQTLATFAGPIGVYPEAPLIFDANGNLYGTTFQGGDSFYGTVFELSPVPEPSSLALCGLALGTVLLVGGLKNRTIRSRQRQINSRQFATVQTVNNHRGAGRKPPAVAEKPNGNVGIV